MATQRTSFAKLQRARDKAARAAAKRERRLDRSHHEGGDAGEAVAAPGDELSTPELLALVEEAHQQFEAGVIDFETFEERKAGLLARLRLD